MLLIRDTGIDLGWRREKSKTVSNFDNFVVGDLLVGPSRHNLEEITVRPDWLWRHVPQLCAGHSRQSDRVVCPVDLDLELLRPAWILCLLVVAHCDSSGKLVSWYHDTKMDCN